MEFFLPQDGVKLDVDIHIFFVSTIGGDNEGFPFQCKHHILLSPSVHQPSTLDIAPRHSDLDLGRKIIKLRK